KVNSVIVYIAVAGVISLIGSRIVLFLWRKLKFNNTVAVVITMAIFIALLLGLVLLFIPLIAQQGHNLALLNMDQLQANIESLYREVVGYFELNHIDIEHTLKEWNVMNKLNFSAIPNFLNTLVSGLGNFSTGLFSVLFISFFFLKDSKLLENGIMTFIPDNKESRWQNSSTKIKDLLSRYFVGLILQILILFVWYTVWLLILGVENAIVIAFLCALLNLIPYVGPLVGVILMVTLTMTSNLGASFSDVIL